jgi:hypothetical protein
MTNLKKKKEKILMDFKLFLSGLVIVIFGLAFLFSQGVILGTLRIIPLYGIVIMLLGFALMIYSLRR